MSNKYIDFYNKKELKILISKLSDPRYESLSFSQKKGIFTEINYIFSEIINSSLDIRFNNKSDEYERDVVTTDDEDLIIVNGLDKNPFIYLKEILIQHIISNRRIFEDEKIYSIGQIIYREDYLHDDYDIALYSEENFEIIKEAKGYMDIMFNDLDEENSMVKELKKDFHYNITDEGKEDLLQANKVMEYINKLGIYNHFRELDYKIDQMENKKRLDKNEAALLSIDEVLNEYILRSQYFNDQEESKIIKYKHLNQFIKYFFPEYENDLKLSIDNVVKINNRKLDEKEIFMDILMQEIEKIESKNQHLKELITDSELEKYNLDNGTNYSKLDLYFVSKLYELDECLNLVEIRLVNGVRWSNVYNSSKNKQVDDKVIFELCNNERFINTIKEYLEGKSKSRSLLLNLVNIMNEICDSANYKLKIIDKITTEKTLGEADDTNNTIYLYVKNNDNKYFTLSTIFHEYRHLMQKEGLNNIEMYDQEFSDLLKINLKTLPTDENYAYADVDVTGYINRLFYDLQPMEYDAEIFAEKLLVSILRKSKIDINKSELRKLFPHTIQNAKFINTDKFSVNIYKNFLSTCMCIELSDYQIDCYKKLDNALLGMKTREDAVNIFNMDFFGYMNFKSKLKVYSKLFNDLDIKYLKSNSCLINGEKCDCSNKNDFEMLEILIKHDAFVKLKEKKLLSRDIFSYVYNFSRDFRTPREKLTPFNYYNAYGYHSVFDKYAAKKHNKLIRVRCKR